MLPNKNKLLFSPKECGEMLGCGVTRVYELFASGALKSVRFGRQTRVHRDDLERFVAKLPRTNLQKNLGDAEDADIMGVAADNRRGDLRPNASGKGVPMPEGPRT